jgi:hypothetical protein
MIGKCNLSEIILHEDIDGVRVELAHPAEYMNKAVQSAERDMGELADVSKLNKEEMWDNLISLQLGFPLKLSRLVKKYAIASNRLDVLERQAVEFKFTLKNKVQRENQRQLASADDIEGALLGEDAYEKAVISRNQQRTYVAMLEKYSEQYRYINNTINTTVETLKLRKELGF